MDAQEAGRQLAAQVAVTREDIARGKHFILQSKLTKTNSIVHDWLVAQKLELRDEINIDAADTLEVLAALARAFSIRMALYTAVWELVSVSELIPAHSVSEWRPELTYRTSHLAGGIRVPGINCFFLPEFFRPPVVSGVPSDPDIFLQGIDCKTLHAGISEGIEQSLGCFRRGLYMPATAMLAAAVEATWTECAAAVAKKLANAKLGGVVNDPLSSVSKIVAETQKALEQPDGKLLLSAAGQHIAKVMEAVVWTNVIRDRRNALHWGKAKSFIADHTETGTLLMAAPLYLGMLESIRTAC